MTLAELLAVLLILIALVGLVVPLLSGAAEDARETATRANLARLREVISRYQLDNEKRLPRPGYSGLNNPPHRLDKPQLRYLFINPGLAVAPGSPESTTNTYDPVARKGWRGPYLLSDTPQYKLDVSRNFTRAYGEDGDPTAIDGWGNPLVILETVNGPELRSAGRDGVLLTSDDLTLPLY
jgi:type II secretory pathway pseudopilin PulG